jgi:hypothetical protein
VDSATRSPFVLCQNQDPTTPALRVGPSACLPLPYRGGTVQPSMPRTCSGCGRPAACAEQDRRAIFLQYWHLRRLENGLGRTRIAVSDLRGLLRAACGPRDHLSGAAIGERVYAKHAVWWLAGALAELHSTLATQSRRAVAPAGGLSRTSSSTIP